MILYAATILVSSFLLFLVQPIIAKQILPWFGGTAAVWSTCLVFFQLALLAGYAYSDLSSRLRKGTQSALHIGLLLLSLIWLPILAASHWKPSGSEEPQLRILGLLAATVGLPYCMLSTTGPLVQSWFAREQVDAATAQRVYRFFALSNIGSLLGLLAYPFAIETWVATRAQALGWSAGYAVFVLLAIGSALRSRRTAPASAAPEGTEKSDAAVTANDAPPPARQYILWLLLSALASVLLLSVSNHITQNVASIPFLWVLPLSLYLLTFVLVFEGRGGRGYYLRSLWLWPTLLVLAAMAWGLVEKRGLLKIQLAIPLYSLGLLLSCTFCHGELAAAKPASRYLTRFYLMMSIGGAAGGLFVGLIAPKLFRAYLELPLSLVACALLALWLTRPRRASSDPDRRAQPSEDRHANATGRWAPVQPVLRVLAPLAALATTLVCAHFLRTYVHNAQKRNVYAARNFYGVLRVVQSAPDGDPGAVRRLLHGVIIHGEQHMDPKRRNAIMSYYGKTSGLGLAVTRAQTGPRRVGVLGLGIGTLAAYGRPGDTYRMYEINPQVLDAASRYFYYLSGSAARIETVLGDARLVLEREAPQKFDVLAIDAFSGDSIPIHLLTREALSIYLRHIKPDGAVVFNVTNRYVDVAPVIQQLAKDAGYQALLISDDAEDDVSDDLFQSDWVIVSNSPRLLADPDVTQRQTPIKPIPGLRIWTDDFSNLFQILK